MMEIWPSLIEWLGNVFTGEAAGRVIIYRALSAVIAALLAWLLLRRLLLSFERRSSRYEFLKIDSRTFGLFRRALAYCLLLVTGTYLLRLFDLRLIENTFHAVLIVLLAAPAKNFLIILMSYLEKNLANRTETKVDNIVFDLLNKFAGVIVYATALVMALDILGVNVMPFIAGAGVAGVAIGFAAKDTLSNLIAGILLIVDRPFEVGDRIEVWTAPAGSATWGDVIDIGLRATRIRTTDNIVVIIPNNEIMMRDIVNYTAIDSKIRVRVNIGIAYDSDIEKVKQLIVAVAGTVDWVSRTPPPKVVVRNFGESSVDLQLRVWIKDARRRMDTISEITDRVKTEFDRTGIEIPYPKRDIKITWET
jgi:small-conductance mechanosensitive channel